jgi:hypothetical protein
MPAKAVPPLLGLLFECAHQKPEARLRAKVTPVAKKAMELFIEFLHQGTWNGEAHRDT